MVMNIYDIIFQPGPQIYFMPVILIIFPLILYYISRDKLNRAGPTRKQSAIMISILTVTFVLPIGVLYLLEFTAYSDSPISDYIEQLLPIITPIAVTSLILFIPTLCFSVYYCAIGRKQQDDPPPQELTEYDEG